MGFINQQTSLGGPTLYESYSQKRKAPNDSHPARARAEKDNWQKIILKSTKNTTLTWYLGMSSSKWTSPHLSVDDFPINPSIYSLWFFHNTHTLPKKNAKTSARFFSPRWALVPTTAVPFPRRTSHSWRVAPAIAAWGQAVMKTIENLDVPNAKNKGNIAMWGPRFR